MKNTLIGGAALYRQAAPMRVFIFAYLTILVHMIQQ